MPMQGLPISPPPEAAPPDAENLSPAAEVLGLPYHSESNMSLAFRHMCYKQQEVDFILRAAILPVYLALSEGGQSPPLDR